MNDKDCLFCRIITGDEPAHDVWEDEKHLAFLSIQPERSGHLLVIPKWHVDYFWNMSETEFAGIMNVVYGLTSRLKAGVDTDKVYVKLIGEDIPHVHVHVVPTSFSGIPKDELEKVADHWRSLLKDFKLEK